MHGGPGLSMAIEWTNSTETSVRDVLRSHGGHFRQSLINSEHEMAPDGQLGRR